jgi:hypothetical protein
MSQNLKNGKSFGLCFGGWIDISHNYLSFCVSKTRGEADSEGSTFDQNIFFQIFRFLINLNVLKGL